MTLEQNIIDVIKEEQIKLGYRSESIRLYYPLDSLNNFLKTGLDEQGMLERLQEYAKEVEPRIGRFQVSNKGERFCIFTPPQAAEYVHNNTPKDGFIYELIQLVGTHGTHMEDILKLFQETSKAAHIEPVSNGEFDYIAYFKDGMPDQYWYCLKDEGHHVIYHRYTKEDYEAFGF